jgi:uncharacterized protein (DUF433 family)
MNQQELLQRIITEPNEDEIIPCIRNTHLSVIKILQLIADGLTVTEILENYPALVLEDIQAVAAYSATIIQQTKHIPRYAEGRAIQRIKDADAPTKWITIVEPDEEIDEENLENWLIERGYKVPLSSETA